jgi:malate dehydrogenase
MRRKKITVIGAGNVGGTTAQRLVEKSFADVVLLDILRDLAVGKALDLAETAPLYRYEPRIIGTDDYKDTAGSDIVIITSGIPRKPGMTRDELLATNLKIVRSVTEQAAAHSPQAVLLVVSNPLDAMTYAAYRISRFPRERVIGMAGVLDAARFRSFIAMELNTSVENIDAFVLGGHGDTMVPLPRYTTVAGVPITELIPPDRLEAIVQRTRDGGAEIVKLLKTGSAYYAPSAAIVEMVEAILRDKKKVLPCAALCRGEYGVNGLFVGVPARLGVAGMEGIFEIRLTPQERGSFDQSVSAVKELCEGVDRMLSSP